MLNQELNILNKKENKRNYGLDLLKIIAMINVINLHINNHTLHLNLEPTNIKYKQILRLDSFSFWPVNAFGLISGIVGYRRFKLINLIYIWFEYCFYSVILSLYLYNKSQIDKRNLFLSFFPLGINRHWYVNAYIFTYLFLPFITNTINSINKNFFTKLVLIYFFLYSIYHIIIIVVFNIKQTNYDYINGGYSTLWLLILYIVGGFIGRFYINKYLISNLIFLSIYLISSLVTSEYIFYSIKLDKHPNKMLLNYFSPTIIIQALSLILFFSNLKIKNKYLLNVINFLNPLNFNVTLIHSRVFYFKVPLLLKFYKFINSLSPDYLFFKIYISSIIIYFICAFFDYFRFLIFKIIKVKNLCYYIEKKLI
mgnify:CR=1 FL=1